MKLTMLGMYKQMRYQSSDLFEFLNVPTGIQKDKVVDNILMETAEFEPVYANPDTLQSMIGIWSDREIDSWNRMYDALTAEYSPIENFDRYEDYTDNRADSGSRKGTNTKEDSGSVQSSQDAFSRMTNASNATSSATNDTSNSETTEAHSDSLTTGKGSSTENVTNHTGSVGNTETLNQVSAFDLDTQHDFSDRDKQTVDTSTTADSVGATENVNSTENSTVDNIDTVANSVQNTSSKSKNTINEDGETSSNNSAVSASSAKSSGTDEEITENSGVTSHTGHLHGNIGVTTNQQMIEAEMKLRTTYNMTKIITESFIRQFCVTVSL